METNQIITGDCLEVMKDWPDNTFDAIITDIPYGIGFMGKEWDTFKPEVIDVAMNKDKRAHIGIASQRRSNSAGSYDHSRNAEYQEWCRQWATQALRVAKPGASLLCFGGTRTFHRVTCGIEDAGWLIRDCLMWLYGSGFPKSLNISKAIDKAKGISYKNETEFLQCTTENEPTKSSIRYKRCLKCGKLLFSPDPCMCPKPKPQSDLAKLWNGYGTALKPAWEPIIVAMKPLDGTFAENAEKWGVAGLNIDGGRIEGNKLSVPQPTFNTPMGQIYGFKTGKGRTGEMSDNSQGRWPANLILDEEATAMLDEQSGDCKTGNLNKVNTSIWGTGKGIEDIGHKGSSGGASRFFYCAKASKAERNAGLVGMEKKKADKRSDIAAGMWKDKNAIQRNHHPTVKPLALMQYLCKLLKPPKGGLLLDPFCGSGTTLMAAVSEGWDYIGIEREADYVEISKHRVRWIVEQKQDQMALFE